MTRLATYLTLLSGFFAYTAVVFTVGTPVPADHAEFSEQVHEGRRLFQAHNCIACHQIYGLGGFMGPDLTNTISTKGEAYARVLLANGTKRMPNFNFSEQEINDIISYLSFLDSSGTSPPQNFELTWYGSLILDEPDS